MNSDRLLVGTRKGLLTWERSDGEWRVAGEEFLGARISYARVDRRDGTLYACLDHGHWGVKLQRSDDDGATWRELVAPAYPEGAMLKDDKPAVLSYIWCIEPGRDDEPGRLYVGTEPGGLFVSDDGGETFAICDALWNHPSRQEMWMGGGRDEAGVHSIVLHATDPQRLMAGISVAGAFVSDDGGGSWQPRNRGLVADFLPDPTPEVGHDPHVLAQCAAEPDVVWQQNHCGIFRTVDFGGEWTKISETDGPADFGFAVAASATDPLAAWVVPAVSDEVRVAVDRALCVCRTTDGGASWQAFRAGLPQQDCYDFVFRHALDIAGQRLAMGTACGSLYVSDDAGESWSCVANHLPPVYSVRFG